MTFQFELPNGFLVRGLGVFERYDEGAETYFVRRKTGEVVRVPARGVRFGKVVEAPRPRATARHERSDLPSAFIRRRLGSEDAHYGGNLVAGAKQLKIVGDLITELAMRYDGDEGLFRAYESVEFLAPLYAGDWIEAKGRIVRVGNSVADVRVRDLEGRRGAQPTSASRRRSSSTSRSSRAGRWGRPSCRRITSGSPTDPARASDRSGSLLQALQHPSSSSTLNGFGMNASAPISAALARSRRFDMAETTTTRGRSSRGSCIISSSTLQPSIVGIMMSSSMSLG